MINHPSVKKRTRSNYVISVVSMGDVARKPFTVSAGKFKAVAVTAACIVVGLTVFMIIGFVRIGEMAERIGADSARLAEYNGELQRSRDENKSLMERLEQALNDLAEMSAPVESDGIRSEPLASDGINDSSSLDAKDTMLEGSAGVTQASALSSLFPTGAKVELLDWFASGHKIYPRGQKATVIDVDTGLSFKVQRFGGELHGDSFPLTKEDTAVFKRIYGGEWSWDRRAIWLVIGNRVVAASMNGMPHMVDANPSDGFSGHFCIHFYKSKVHENEKECPIHQKMVKKAFETGQQFQNKQL